jgi:hypothetical protein
MKCVFSFTFLLFVRNIFRYDIEPAVLNMEAKIYKHSSAKCPLRLSDFNQHLEVTTSTAEFPYIRRHENPFSGSRFVSCVQIDTHEEDRSQIFANIRLEHVKLLL